MSFNFYCPTRVIFGSGSISQCGDSIVRLGGKRVLIVTDPGVKAVGHLEKVLNLLQGFPFEWVVFDQVEENPSTDNVQAGVQLAKAENIDFLLALGGGSSLDCAKGINFIYTNGGEIKDYWGFGHAKKKMLPSLAIPTTTGTGSEVQSYALISDSKTHAKMACGDPKAAFQVAILEPSLAQTQPPFVIALSGIDAISHALESAVTLKRNSFSTMLSHQAWKLLIENFVPFLNSPCDLEACSQMQIGACLAGLAIENSMLGAAHSCANPLTQNYQLAHGQAIALMLPYIVEYNAPVVENIYTQLCQEVNWTVSNKRGGEVLSRKIADLVLQGNLQTTSDQLSLSSSEIKKMAEEASQQWTAQFNPRSINVKDFESLYHKALSSL